MIFSEKNKIDKMIGHKWISPDFGTKPTKKKY